MWGRNQGHSGFLEQKFWLTGREKSVRQPVGQLDAHLGSSPGEVDLAIWEKIAK
jgi:hypothetical protein